MAQPKATSPSSPWGATIASPVVKPFRDMMDEEYAKQLVEKDVKEEKEDEEYLEHIKQLSLQV